MTALIYLSLQNVQMLSVTKLIMVCILKKQILHDILKITTYMQN